MSASAPSQTVPTRRSATFLWHTPERLRLWRRIAALASLALIVTFGWAAPANAAPAAAPKAALALNPAYAAASPLSDASAKSTFMTSAAGISAGVASLQTGNSSDNRITVTKTASPTSLPVGGGTVTYTYTVKNNRTASSPSYYNGMYYSRMTDDTCANVNPVSGLSTDPRGDQYIAPGATATFTCVTTVTATVTNTITATFEDYYYYRPSTATAQATVTVAVPAISCDTLVYGSDDNGSKGGLGTVSTASTGTPTQLADIATLASSGDGSYDGTAAVAISPTDPTKIYYIPRASGNPTDNNGLWVYDTTTNTATQVTEPSAATTTNRLAIGPDGTIWTITSTGTLYAIAPGTTTWVQKGTVSGMSRLSSGDVVFDGLGNMWVIGSDGSTNKLFTISAAQLAGGGTITPTTVGNMGTGLTFNGLAFDTKGNLYASGGNNPYSSIYLINKETGAATKIKDIPTTYGYAADLQSCALPKPELRVSKTVSPTSVGEGGLVTYVVKIENIGTLSATGVKFTDTNITGGTYQSSTLNGTAVGTTGSNYWTSPQLVRGSQTTNAGVIPAGDAATITIVVKAGTGVTAVCNQGTASFNGGPSTGILTDNPDTAASPDTTCADVVKPGIAVDKTASATTLESAGPVTYTYKVTNTGNEPLKTVTLTDDKCAAPTLQAADATAGTGDLDADGLLDVRETWVYTCTQTISATTTNTATAKGAGNISGTNVSATDPWTVTFTNPKISLTKTPTPATVTTAGQTVTYTFVSTNTGDVPLTQVTISDTSLPGLSPIGGCTVAGAAVTNGSATLQPGQTMTCTATYVVTQTDINKGTIDNTAKTTGVSPGGKTVEAPATAKVTATQTPAITLDKSSASRPTAAGQTITYTFAAKNTGNTTLTNVKIADPKSGLSAIAGCTVGTTSVTNGTATLQPGQTMTCTATYVATQADVDAGTVTNTATVTGTSPAGATITATDPETVPIPKTSAIDVTKTATPTEVSAVGQTITYTITAKNTGNQTLNNVTVTDPKAGVTITGCTLAGAAATNGSVTLKPGETLTCTATYVVTQADLDGKGIANVAYGTGTTPGGDKPTDTDPETVTPKQTSQITLAKDANVADINGSGKTVTYTFVATNTGNTTLTNVTIADPKTGMSPIGSCTVNGAAVTNGSATLLPGQRMTCTATYVVTQDDMNAGLIHNEATVTGSSPTGPVSAKDPADVTTSQQPGIEVVKTASVSNVTAVGQTITYTFTATNTGNTTLTSVKIEDPKGGLSALGGCTAYGTGITGSVTATNGTQTLQPGQIMKCTATYVTTQADMDAGSILNTATATGIPPKTAPVTDTDPETVTTEQRAAIDLVKTASTPTVSAVGQTITYTFTSTNTGNTTLSNVGITDTSLPGLSPIGGCTVSGTGISGSVAGSNGTQSLNPGQTLSCTATYVTTQTDLNRGYIANTATTTGTTPKGGTVTDTDPENVTVNQTSSIDLIKTAASGTTVSQVGDLITYTFTAKNTGNTTLTKVKITDPKIATIGGCTVTGTGITGTTPGTNDGTQTLQPGQTLTCTGTYAVTQAELDAQKVDNTATGTGTTPGGGTVSDPDPETVVPTTTPSIDLVKTASPSTYLNGTVVTYSFVVTNTGNVTLNNVSVTDTGLTGLSPLVCSPSAPGTLAPKASMTCTATKTMSQTDVDSGSVYNKAYAAGTTTGGQKVTDNDDETVTSAGKPAITLQKTASAATYAVGDTITYTFVVTNKGSVSLTNVAVTDTGLTGLSALTCTPLAPAGLAPNATMTCTATKVMNQADMDAGSVYNKATAAGTPPTGPAVTATDDETVTASANPKLALTKTAAGATAGALATYTVGQTVTYTFTAENKGNTTLTGVTITDVADRFTGTGDISALNCAPMTQPATLAPGAKLTCTATYVPTQADVDAGAIYNLASADSTQTPPVTDDETVESGAEPAFTFVKTASQSTYKVGDTVTYTFVMKNTGGVSLTDAGIHEVSWTGSGPMSALTCDPLQPAKLAPNDTLTCKATYVVTQADVDQGELINVAAATGTPVGQTVPLPEQTSTVTITSTAAPGIELVKTASQATFVAGDTVTYTFTVKNTGNVTLTGVNVDDSTLGVVDLVCSPATLVPGATCTATATKVMSQADVDAGSFLNTATATGTTPTGGTTSDTDDETVTSTAAPGIELVKTASQATFVAGDTVTYTFTVKNTGNVTLTGVNVDDSTLGVVDLVCSPATLVPGATCTATATKVMSQADVDAGSFLNTATATGTTPTGGTTSDTDDETVTSGAKPAFTFVKSVDSTTFTEGQTLTYTFVMANTGAVTLKDATITEGTFTGTGDLSALTCDPAQPATLAPGATLSCTATYVATQKDVDAGLITNSASATATPVNTNTPLTPVTDDETVDAVTDGKIQIVKSVADGTTFTKAGDVINYTLVATNTGTVTLSNVTISDPKLGDLTCTPQQPATLAPKATLTCTGSYSVTQDDVDAKKVDNTATVTGTTPSGQPVTDDDTVTVPGSGTGALTLDKSVAAGTTYTKVGDAITYTLKVTNSGTVTLHDVKVEDPMLPSLTCTPAQPATLKVGQSVECTGTYLVTQADVDKGSVKNTATATGNGPDGTPVNPSEDDVTVPGSGQGAITLAKTVADGTTFSKAGDQITYTLVATNTGDVTLHNVTVTDPMLATLTCTPAQPGTLEVKQQMACTGVHTVTQADVDKGKVLNTATAKGDQPDGTPVTPSDDDVTVPGNGTPNLALEKTVVAGTTFAEAGDVITYTLTATNTGTVTLTNVTISDPKLGTLACTPANGSSLAPGASMVCHGAYAVTQDDVDAGKVVNTATADSDQTTPKDDDVTVPGNGTPNLALEKTVVAGTTFAEAGDVITYTLTATNTGTVTLTNVTISDPKLGTLACTPANGSSLAPGASMVCHGAYAVTQDDVDAGKVVNTATADSDQTTPKDDDVTVPGNGFGAIDLEKSVAASTTFSKAGDKITYTLSVTNTGTVTVSNVAVTDPLLGALSCTPAQPGT
ncbi:MAG: DUF11 domain-containing protein, partial [Micrococcales bacterium]|nr:DUF11 domain-containing protein [Micrococcales bacterium]